MKPVLNFKAYGVYGTPVSVATARITHWFPIDYNGVSGVEIQLDTGKSLRVDGYFTDINKTITEALGEQ
jgi:hypothetical protein